MSQYKAEESLIKGLILLKITDFGPEVVSNHSPINDESSLITALHMVSLAGLEESMDPDASKILGPLPVKGTNEFRALYYSDTLKASDVTDERLIEHGAKVGVILLFSTDDLPKIRRASGIIEPYLQLSLSKIAETGEIDKKFGKELFEHIMEIISKPRLRTFYVTEESIIEYNDPGFIRKKDNFLIIDEEANSMIFVVNDKSLSPFVIRKLKRRVDKANSDLYRGGMQVKRLESFEEVEPLLLKHGIRVM